VAVAKLVLVGEEVQVGIKVGNGRFVRVWAILSVSWRYCACDIAVACCCALRWMEIYPAMVTTARMTNAAIKMYTISHLEPGLSEGGTFPVGLMVMGGTVEEDSSWDAVFEGLDMTGCLAMISGFTWDDSSSTIAGADFGVAGCWIVPG
jgi:hypothetical protein